MKTHEKIDPDDINDVMHWCIHRQIFVTVEVLSNDCFKLLLEFQGRKKTRRCAAHAKDDRESKKRALPQDLPQIQGYFVDKIIFLQQRNKNCIFVKK